MAVAAAAVGCSLLVKFVDEPEASPVDAGFPDVTALPDVVVAIDASDAFDGDAPIVDAQSSNPCLTLADGAKCGDAGLCNEPSTCEQGVCKAHPNEGGALCGFGGGCNCEYCKNGACSATRSCPEGFNWEAGNPLARCCKGIAVLTNNNENCGVCGVVCQTAGVSTPQDCAPVNGHYQCTNCSTPQECWSNCCSSTTTPHCAPSDCTSVGNCTNVCPAPAVCKSPGGGLPNYCAYP